MWVQNDAILLTPLHPQPQQLGVSQTRNQARKAAGSHNQVSSMLHYIGREDGNSMGDVWRAVTGRDARLSPYEVESRWSLTHMPSG